jgi:hypothetical protein
VGETLLASVKVTQVSGTHKKSIKFETRCVLADDPRVVFVDGEALARIPPPPQARRRSFLVVALAVSSPCAPALTDRS